MQFIINVHSIERYIRVITMFCRKLCCTGSQKSEGYQHQKEQATNLLRTRNVNTCQTVPSAWLELCPSPSFAYNVSFIFYDELPVFHRRLPVIPFTRDREVGVGTPSPPPPRMHGFGMLRDTVNKWMKRLRLECFLLCSD